MNNTVNYLQAAQGKSDVELIFNSNTVSDLNDYDHMDGICIKYPQLTKNQLRWLAANKDRYKIAHAIKRIGRRLYFHIPSLISWISEQNA